MEAHIFAEGSTTTSETTDQTMKEYYGGLFSTVTNLHEEISEVANTNLHILDEDYGVAKGSDQASEVLRTNENSVGFEKMVQTGQKELLSVASDADIMIILLSSDVFDATVPKIWTELVDRANPNSIWCLSAAKSSISSLDIEKLEAKGCTVFTYNRVGVARIGSDTREELLESIILKSNR